MSLSEDESSCKCPYYYFFKHERTSIINNQFPKRVKEIDNKSTNFCSMWKYSLGLGETGTWVYMMRSCNNITFFFKLFGSSTEVIDFDASCLIANWTISNEIFFKWLTVSCSIVDQTVDIGNMWLQYWSQSVSLRNSLSSD